MENRRFSLISSGQFGCASPCLSPDAASFNNAISGLASRPCWRLDSAPLAPPKVPGSSGCILAKSRHDVSKYADDHAVVPSGCPPRCGRTPKPMTILSRFDLLVPSVRWPG